ncbi:MAG: cell division protein FtsQ/DivIB [Acidimicrobiales bacterium]
MPSDLRTHPPTKRRTPVRRPGPTPRPGPRPRTAPANARQAPPSPRRDRRPSRPIAERLRDVSPIWWLALCAVAVAGCVLTVFRASFFEVRDVQISGAARTAPGMIHEVLALDAEQALVSVDIGSAEKAVAALPWVEQVDISRRWPSTLRVTVREHAPAVAIGRPDASRWIVVSADGTVLERRLTPPASLPLVAAPKAVVDEAVEGTSLLGSGAVVDAALDLPAQLAPWIETWTVDSRGVVSAELVGSAKAVFGDDLDHRTRFVSLASILDGGVTLSCISAIDLTIADSPVVHRNRDCLARAGE